MKKLLQLLRRLKNPIKPKSEEDLKEAMFVRIARLRKLMNTPEWKEYISIVEEYVERCQIQKLQYNFAHAYMIGDEKTFKMAAFLSNDIDMAQRLIDIAPAYVKNAELQEKIAKEQQEESHD